MSFPLRHMSAPTRDRSRTARTSSIPPPTDRTKKRSARFDKNAKTEIKARITRHFFCVLSTRRFKTNSAAYARSAQRRSAATGKGCCNRISIYRPPYFTLFRYLRISHYDVLKFQEICELNINKRTLIKGKTRVE